MYKIILLLTGWKDEKLFAAFPPWPLLLVIPVMMAWTSLKEGSSHETFGTRFRLNARFALLTAVGVSLSVGLYYAFIDVSAFQEMIEVRLQAYKEVPSRVPLQEYEKNLHRVFNPYFYATLTLSGLTAYGLMMSAAVAGLSWFWHRK
ncbi:MAG: manganese efflux pump MntP family protein [Flavobacteriales bacterium]|nr:manganese efflux pump MntP family protein [Flavobacteriales bacterium]MCX7767779.1 manganese efflux pump MntP family protein [Flavobacteriales bacterium]MDW8410624.1 hypothetical protein [Flavobacteriales bacterium]